MKTTLKQPIIPKNDWLRNARYTALKAALKKTGNELAPAARLIGISLPTARKHARRLGLWPLEPLK